MSVWVLFILSRFFEDVLHSDNINDDAIAILPSKVLNDEVFVLDEDGDDNDVTAISLK